MTAPKRTIHLTGDNFADYFSDDYPAPLVERLRVGEGGVDRDHPIVTKLLERLAEKNERSALVQYNMTRHDAAVVLEQLAGYPNCLFVAAAFAQPPPTGISPPAPGRPKNKPVGGG